jgi:hypothetical protein
MVDDYSGIGFTGFASKKNGMSAFVEDKIDKSRLQALKLNIYNATMLGKMSQLWRSYVVKRGIQFRA